MKISPHFRSRARMETSVSALALILSLSVDFSFIYDMSKIQIVAAKYPTILTPALYTFTIWTVIYIFGFISVGVWFFYAAQDKLSFIEQRYARSTTIIVSLLNALWTYAWIKEEIFSSWVLIMAMLALLALNDHTYTGHCIYKRPLLSEIPHTFFGIYFGWVSIAVILNTLVLLRSKAVLPQMGGAAAPCLVWSIALFAAWKVKKGNTAYGAAVLWAIVGIYRQKLSVYDGKLSVLFIFLAALFLSGVVLIKETRSLFSINSSHPAIK